MIVTLISQSYNIRISKQYKFLKLANPENLVTNIVIINKEGYFLNFEKVLIDDIKNILKSSDLLHIHGPNYSKIYEFIKNSSAKKIFDPYDIVNLYGYSRFWKIKEKILEKKIFNISDAVVTKFPKSIFKELNLNYRKKKYLLFFDYCDDSLFINNDVTNIKKSEIIYTGVYDWSILPKILVGNNQIYNLKSIKFIDNFPLKIIIQSNIDSNIFYNNLLLKIENFIFRRYNIQICPKINYLELNHMLKSAKYGLQFNDFKNSVHKGNFEFSSFGNKYFSYLEAGIPIICNSNLKWNAFWVRKFKVGLTYNFRIKNQNIRISDYNYQILSSNVLKVRSSKLSFLNNINRLVSFYKGL